MLTGIALLTRNPEALYIFMQLWIDKSTVHHSDSDLASCEIP